MTTRYSLAVALLFAVALAGCGDDGDGPTTPTTLPPSISIFNSHVTVGGSAARTFASRAGTISVHLRNTSATTPLGIGLGLPYGSGVSNCILSTTVEARPASEPQIAATVDIGSYCVVVYDLGTLTATTDFDVLIVYP
jgi:hypothetical protein